MYLGIDIGTSGVKAVLVDDDDVVVAQAAHPLAVSRPRPLWSEQDPDSWWQATEACLDTLARDAAGPMRRVRAIGLSGQMLGVTAIDRAGHALRPAMLWNDGRAAAAGAALEAEIADFAGITGARAMPGFSAPKIRWLRDNEPGLLERVHRILLPKDFVRLHLTGELASDRADASATLLMDTRAGDWHPGILAACGITRDQLPDLMESSDAGGALRPELSLRWGLPRGIPVAGGGGDNMCGAVGAGVVGDGSAYISLGTSAVYFVASESFNPSLGLGMHTHRHAVPALFCQQAVVLSAAASLSWILDLLSIGDLDGFMAQLEAASLSPDDTPLFTPYLAGERTPHDDPDLTAGLSRLTFASGRLHVVQAVLEGVALALADCHDALLSAGARIERPSLIGGGARSRLWARLIASAIGTPLDVPLQAAVGPAMGAARLARAAIGGPLIADAARAAAAESVSPDAALAASLQRKRAAFRSQRGTGR